MKRKNAIKILSLLFVCFLAMGVVACKGGKDSESQHSPSSSVDTGPKTQLETPQNLEITLNYTENTTQHLLTWDEVAEADGYTVKVNSKEYKAETNEFDLTSRIALGTKPTISVKATSKDARYSASEASSFSYLVKNATDGLCYTAIDGGYEVHKGDKNISSALILPDLYNGVPIIKIQDYGFSTMNSDGSTNKNKIIAFTSIRYPKHLTAFGHHAFSRAQIAEIDIPDAVTVIEEGTFNECEKLQRVNLNKVTKIGDNAFDECDLKEVVIPKTVTEIGSYAFTSNVNLKTVTIEGTITECGSLVFKGCSSLEGIPEGLTVITKNMFRECASLINPVIPASVKKICIGAFIECNMQSLYIPATVTEIEHGAFAKCLPNGNLTIDESHPTYKIANNALLTIDGKTLVMYLDKPFAESYTVPAEIEEIASYSFYAASNLKTVTLQNGLKTIGEYAFQNSGLSEIYLPDSVTSFGKGAFVAPNLTKIRLSNGLTEICDYAFSNSNLVHIEIPDSVTKIGNGAFTQNAKLESVVFPKNLTSVSPQSHLFGGMGYHPITPTIYYKGSAEDWQRLMSEKIILDTHLLNYSTNIFMSSTVTDVIVSFLSQDQPEDSENNYWYYDENGTPTPWIKQEQN